MHVNCLSIPFASPPRFTATLRHLQTAVSTAAPSCPALQGEAVLYLDLRVFGRTYSLQPRGASLVNFTGWRGRAQLDSGCVLYALGPVVLYVDAARGSEPRFELLCGRVEVSF